jgi:CheY-like chemotaxis protein
MIRHCPRWGIGIAFLATLTLSAPAQEGKDAPGKEAPANDNPPATAAQPAADDYRQFFKKPQTPLEFWKAMQFELEVGRPDLAATLLHGLLESKPGDDAWVALVDREGMAAMLRLRNIRPWVPATKPDLKDTEAEIARLTKSRNDLDRLNRLRDEVKSANKAYEDAAKISQKADQDVETLIATVTEAARKVRGDPKRIAAFIGLLSASPEEGAYALKELYKAGALAVPQILDVLRAPDATDRAELLDALRRLGRDVVPPMLAALEGDDVQLKVDLLDVIRRRAATEAVPHLWYLSAAPSQPEIVRRKAAETLAAFLETQPSRLPPAKVALTQEAERYYRHEVLFPDRSAVTIWRWDNGHVVAGWPGARTVPATAAEEYWGIHFANQALALDPTYRPAQITLLSLALEKGAEKAGLAQPLSRGAPRVHALLATASPELIDAVLERAFDERRTPVVLNTVRTLGGLADPRSNRPSVKGEAVLVRALHYPDRRVQVAAAEAILRGAQPIGQSAAGRVVEILRRSLAAEPAAANVPKVLVGYPTPEYAGRVAEAVRLAGFEPVVATTGREVLRRLGQAADIDLVLLDAALPDPGLAGLLGQLAADNYAGHLPVVLTASPAREDALRRFTARDPRVTVAPAGIALAPKELQGLLKSRLADAAGGPPLSAAEIQDYAERAIRHLNELARGNPTGFDVRPAAEAILDALRSGKLSPEGQLAAIGTAGRLYGVRTQNELVAVILDTRRPLPVRVAATTELIRHIQQNSALITRLQAGALEAAFADGGTDPALKAELALLLGSLKPDARATGERLLHYQPTPPVAGAPAATAKEPEKDEKKEEKKEEKEKEDGK